MSLPSWYTAFVTCSSDCMSTSPYMSQCGVSQTRLTVLRGKNVATVLVGRWFQGLSGCIGATVVAGTVSDLYPPAKYVDFPISHDVMYN